MNAFFGGEAEPVALVITDGVGEEINFSELSEGDEPKVKTEEEAGSTAIDSEGKKIEGERILPDGSVMVFEAGELIEPKVIVDAYQKLLATGVDTLLVEGAGGIYVPIVDDYTMLDLMKDLGIPVIIVGTVELGSINHALLSINALKNAGLDIAGIVLNKVPQKPSLIEQDNIETIQKLGNVPLLGVINTLDNPSADSLFTQINTSDFHNLFT